jgi:hypothetical protein
MIRYERECVDCGLPCVGQACPHFSVPHYYCDDCDEERDTYHFESEELCINCIKSRLVKVGE